MTDKHVNKTHPKLEVFELVSPSNKEKGKSKGLGDTVEKVIRKVTGGKVKPCGKCKKRKEVLNKYFPYKK